MSRPTHRDGYEVPHTFAPEMIAFMELLARWSVSEYERQQLAIALAQSSSNSRSERLLSTTDVKGGLLDTVRLTLHESTDSRYAESADDDYRHGQYAQP
jgi:hypothetical protein